MKSLKIPSSVKANLKLCEEWKHTPEGTEVVVTLDQFDKRGPGDFRTKTRSAPWMLGADSRDPSDPTHNPGHTAVILLEGISGAYALSRVRKA